MKLALACDHGAFLYKEELVKALREQGHTVIDFGCNSLESVDYPDIVFPAAEAVASGACERGIFLCTTGIGVSICANKVKGIRCALCTQAFQAEMTRRHNDTNVLALGQKTVSLDEAKEIVRIWLATDFEGGRHERRIQKISTYENNRR